MAGDAWRLTPATFGTVAAQSLGVKWIPAAHLLKASAEIASAVYKGGARILVQWPPRHGKSEMLSVYTPMWFLDNFPDKRVAMASYGSELIEDFSVRVRDNINALRPSGLLSVELREDRQRVENFLTTKGGALRAVGVGGPLTGRGADLLLIDDYLKNAKDAMSQQIRNDQYDWFRSVAFTRLEPGASIIIFAARWDVDDLAGRIYRDMPDVWKIIRFSAICDDPVNDPLGRPLGKALWPERYNEEALAIIQRTLGKFFWAALYQQKPLRKVEGLTRDVFPIVTGVPHKDEMRWVRSWDFAATDDGGDYTVGTLIGEHWPTGLLYIADVLRGQWSPAKLDVLVKDTTAADNRKCFTSVAIEQEPGSAGKVAYEHFKNLLKGYEVKDMPAAGQGSKVLRATPFIAAAEAGVVHLLQADWNSEWLDEVVNHPDCDPDDQRDSAAIGFNRLMQMSGKTATWGRVDPKALAAMAANNNTVNEAYRTGAGWGSKWR